MTNTNIETISPISLQTTDRNLQLLLERAYSPYKPTLRNQTREDSLLKYLRGISEGFYNIVAGNPDFLELLRSNPQILTLLATNNKIIDIILNKPALLNKFLEDPEGFTRRLSVQIQTQETASKRTESATPKLDQKIERSLLNIQKAKETLLAEKLQIRIPEKYELYRSKPPVIGKMQIENTNTRVGAGEFRTFTRGDYRKIALANGPELESTNISNNKTFAFNPTLTGVLGALSAIVNYLKIKDSKEKGFESETQIEFENALDETLKEVSEVSRSEASTRISANLK